MPGSVYTENEDVTAAFCAGAGALVARVGFDAVHARHSRAGLYATIDTRVDPSFPRNAVHATVAWDALSFSDHAGGVGRWLTDLRGYVGIGGARVLALRGFVARS